jgi:hypothetical protein
MKAQLDESTAKLGKIEAERDSLRGLQKSNENLIKMKQDSVMNLIKMEKPGFLDEIMMLERLSSSGKSVPKFDPAKNKIIEGQEIEIYGSAFWPIWLVRLLFMIIEIAPVLLKLMLVKGPYDHMSENVNQILESKQGISLVYMKDEYSQVHKLKENFNPKRIIEIVAHQNEKETENAKEAIDKFAEQEKEKIRKNPEDFIKPSEA